ncbi:zf-HC2 domain-containing protein [Pyxidicoccus fallax]|uniref:Zf-HC2 domain-containing protein n=1 Tax=Pyxidicoccus fallax TaxID=394095 RepID=A0A848LAH1_9BACT|nr:zf-HC2 domain-containing protein [Pyxidicoccus fallax]NMO15252.1 zf-HC2 domain-containing protein [Pyxidicoccus fallax]NPC76976.1 zf-HC2 domain-containing protein [Pyxidicoccus fallax]
MVVEPFPRSKASDDCLSGWRVSQVVLGLLPPEERAPAEAHLGTCEHCRKKVDAEHAQARAAAYEPVPEALLAAAAVVPPRPVKAAWSPWRWVPAFAAVPALALGVFIAVRTPTEVRLPGGTLKGTASLDVAVARDGTLVVNGMPAEEVAGLRAGDRLRLRVRGTEPSAWLILQGDEEGQWTPYFEGPVPQGGWLPMGITITPEGRTRMRLLSCAEKPPRGVPPEEVCRVRVYDWGLAGAP